MTHHISSTKRFLFVLSMAVATVSFSGAISFGQGIAETIVRTGDAAPDGDGAFSALFHSFINEAGQVGFVGWLDGANTLGGSGIFRGEGGALTQIAREGQAIPNSSDVFGQFTNSVRKIQINDAGAITFYSGGSSGGIYRSDGSSTTVVVRSGQTVPGGSSTFGISSSGSFTSNNLGQTAFTSLESGHFNAYRESGGVFEAIATTGQAIPGGDGSFTDLTNVLINSSGQVAFTGFLTGRSDGATRGIYREHGGSIVEIVNNQQAAPDGNGTFAVVAQRLPVFNNVGHVGFQAIFRDTSGGETDNEGIYISDGVTLKEIVREGQAAPDGNGNFGSSGSALGISGPSAINDMGQAVFQSVLRNTTDGLSVGVYRGDGDTITQIVRSGDLAPDGNGTFVSHTNGVINNAGLVGMLGSFGSTSGGATDNKGILLGDGTDLVQVARTGDVIDGSAISTLLLAPVDSLNSSGQVAYMAILENGNRVVQRWTPELSWRATEDGDWSDPNQWTLGITPGAVHRVSINSDTDVTISVPTDVVVGSISIGGGAGSTTVSLQGGALTTTNGLNVSSNGVLSGTGTVSGDVNNSGIIEADNLVFDTSIMNSGTGIINVGSGANVTTAGDLVQNGSMNITGNGSGGGSVTVRGTFSGSGGFFGGGRLFSRGRFRLGNSPASVTMDGSLILAETTLSEFEFAGEDIGEFDQMIITNDLFLDGELTVVELNGFSFELGQEFIIAEVGNTLSGQFDGLSEGGLIGNFGGTDLFISYMAGDGNDVAFFTTAVPEPSTVFVLGISMLGFLVKRRRA